MSSRLGAARAGARRRGGRVLPRHPRRPRREILLGTGVAAFEGSDRGATRPYRRRPRLDCDLVVVGVGVGRARSWPRPPGSRRQRRCWSTDASRRSHRVFAAGDVPTQPSALGRAFVSSTGPTRSTRARPPPAPCSVSPSAYERLPYFFSDQYDVGMEYSGYAAAGTGSSSAAIRRARVHRVLARGGRVARRHECQRVGRHRLHPGAHPRASPSTTAARRHRRPARGAHPRWKGGRA